MLILGFILIILAFYIFNWTFVNLNKPSYDRPMILNKTKPVLFIQFIWITLLLLGLYCLWKVSGSIVIGIVVVIFSVLTLGMFLGTDKNKAKRFFKIYKKILISRPDLEEREVRILSTKLFLKKQGKKDFEIDSLCNYLFGEEKEEFLDKEIKDFIRYLFLHENPDQNNLDMNYFKKMAKTESSIEKAYNQIIGPIETPVERPVLSEDVIKQIKKDGINPDEMSDEQLIALQKMYDGSKGNWFVQVLYLIALISIFRSVIDLFQLDFTSILINLVVIVLCVHVGSVIQTSGGYKKFKQASIKNFAEKNK